MSGSLVWLAVGLGLAASVLRRRSVAIAVVAAQSLTIAVAAAVVTPERTTEFLAASLALVVRGALLGAVLVWTVRRTPEPRPVDQGVEPLIRLTAVIAIAFAAAALVPSFGLEVRSAEQAAVALVAVGMATVVARRATLFQMLGLLVAENGVAIAATAVPGGIPIVIELGVVFDLIVVIAAATAFHERIFGEFGSGDTQLLRGLRD